MFNVSSKSVFLHCVVSTEKKESKEIAAEKVEEDPEGIKYKNIHHRNYYFKYAAVY